MTIRYIADPTRNPPAVLVKNSRASNALSLCLVAGEMADPVAIANALNDAFEEGRKARQDEIRQILGMDGSALTSTKKEG